VNRLLLRAAQEETPPGAEVVVWDDLATIPAFDQDDEASPAPAVTSLRAAIAEADALLIATPEYNYSVSGVLKNAIDWASRPIGDNSFAGKPVAVMSASIGMLGGARAQYHLRQMLVYIDMLPVNKPEVMVAFAADKIDEKGNVNDAKTREKIKELVESLVAWARRLNCSK
jgi:chromate reductase